MAWPLKMRIFAFSMFSVVFVGACAALFVLLMSESAGAFSLLTSLTDIAGLLAISLLASLPITVIGGAVGGAVAVMVAKAPAPHRRRWGWVRIGVLWGLGLGTCVIVAFCALIGLPSGDALAALQVITPVGAVAGALSGALVGAYCYCALNRSHARAA